ncbi:MAG: glycosyl hydrolase 115 family protein, partial [Ferruginibacter sp.]
IIIGTAGNSSVIKLLEASGKLDVKEIKNKWEAYSIQSIKGVVKTSSATGAVSLIIAGSDRRGVAFGVLELSKQIGVSPWYWWADVPVKKQPNVYINTSVKITDSPKVKYRGFFINDEAPALSGWSKEKFGGFNHQFYEKVFELLLRLKGNYLWPAMWGSAFNTDDTLNPVLADQYGIVMGTSHHEPMMRSQQEWKKLGKGAWDYTKNDTLLRNFWKKGIENMQSHESLVTLAMRGDGDMPMTQGTATELLERIVKDQRKIIEEVTGKPAEATPQLWALYKEVQDYYDKGMRVPDDVTLLLCDDNWGNLRKLPKLDTKPRKGGYGIYYHFDYVGGPRNYKWLNTNAIPRVWEQMHLAYEYNVKNVWVVNVGDIKPMEFPLSFFLDYAWNPDRIGPADLQKYTEQWSAAAFGKKYAKEIAAIISQYSKFNSRRKPEMLDAGTYSFNYGEWTTVVNDYNALLKKAEAINSLLAAEYKDAFFQLVLHPVKACANLNELYFYVALNKKAYANKWEVANQYADKVKELYNNDSLITLAYHQLNNGKWNHLMDQKYIGYTSWQEPRLQRMPEVKYVPRDSVQPVLDTTCLPRKAEFPKNAVVHSFQETNGYVSMNAEHFTKAINSNGIAWTVLPDHGRTAAAITPFPVTAKEQVPAGNAPQVQYEFYTYSMGDFTVNAYFSPTLNFNNTDRGMQYAISVDDEAPQIISVNKEERANEGGIVYNWVGPNIIIKTSKHHIVRPGKHVIRYWMVSPAVILQKLLLDFGGLKPCYLGPEETIDK